MRGKVRLNGTIGALVVATLSLPLVTIPTAGIAVAGGVTESLGQSHGLEYVRGKLNAVTAQAGAEAVCDAEDSATGGGGSISGNTGNASLNASSPTAPVPGWQARGSTSGAQPRVVTAYAICGNQPVGETTNTETFPAGTSFGDGRVCPGAAVGTSGGLSATGSDVLINAMVPNNPPFDFLISYTNPGPGDATVTAYARCTDVLEVRTRTSEVKRIDPGESGKAIASCKASEAVVGGGLETAGDSLASPQPWVTAIKPWDSKADRRRVPDDGWLARAHHSGTKQVELTAYAVCKR